MASVAPDRIDGRPAALLVAAYVDHEAYHISDHLPVIADMQPSMENRPVDTAAALIAVE